MSRVASNPVTISAPIEFNSNDNLYTIKGPKGSMSINQSKLVEVNFDDGKLTFKANGTSKNASAMSGTIRALLNNMVIGVSTGFSKKLKLVGVGYKAQSKGSVLNLNLGYSHPIDFKIIEGISIDTPSPTEVIVNGIDKQRVGQVAAQIRALRAPEPYKGKGVRYVDEVIKMKETKKK